MANTIINTRRLNWFRLGFLIEDEMKVEMLDRLHCYATSIWLRAIMQLLRNDGSMPERTLLASLSTRHISRPKIREILESTGDFMLNKANGHIVLSETILQQILPDTKRMNASNNEDQPAAKTQESSTPIENRPSNHDCMGKNETKNARQTTISSEKCPPNDDFAGKNEMKQGSKTDLDNNVRPNIESKSKNKKENKNISVSDVCETPTTPTEPERETKAAIDKGKKAASESRVSPEEADFNRQMNVAARI